MWFVGISQDPWADIPVNAFIGMDIPTIDNGTGGEYDDLNTSNNEYQLDHDNLEVLELDTSSEVHPLYYFSKCLTEAVDRDCNKRVNHPSNGVSIQGYLKLAAVNRIDHDALKLYLEEAEVDYIHSNWTSDPTYISLAYRLEIVKIKLYSIYGCQTEINLKEFQYAKSDILVYSASAILEDFKDDYDDAFKALCKKKGLDVEGASLIGVDSLGMDVRAFSGTEVKTHRFPFSVVATSADMAKNQIQQLLFTPSCRKRYARLKSRRGMLKIRNEPSFFSAMLHGF